MTGMPGMADLPNAPTLPGAGRWPAIAVISFVSLFVIVRTLA